MHKQDIKQSESFLSRILYMYSHVARVLNILKMNYVHVIPIEKLEVILIHA